jgi:hypothetical protein
MKPGNFLLQVIRKIYVLFFALSVFPVGWVSGMYLAKLTGNQTLGYATGFLVGILFLLLPFIISRLRQ